MNIQKIMHEVEKSQLTKEIPSFQIGDTLRISTKIVEGSKERIQDFEGVCIARKGHGINQTISLHRIAYKEGMEKVFLIHNPRIVKIQVMRQGRVRRAKLYYLRGKKGKAAKVKARLR